MLTFGVGLRVVESKLREKNPGGFGIPDFCMSRELSVSLAARLPGFLQQARR